MSVVLLTPGELAELRAAYRSANWQEAAIYGPSAATGAYTEVLQAALPCRLGLIPRQRAVASDRPELALSRMLYWDPDYAPPEDVQVEIAGVRWNPVAGTHEAWTGPDGVVVYRRAEVVRALA